MPLLEATIGSYQNIRYPPLLPGALAASAGATNENRLDRAAFNEIR